MILLICVTRLFGHSILFSVEPEEAYHFRSVLLPLFSPGAFSCENGRIKSDGEEKGSWYSVITRDICDNWFKMEIDPYTKKEAHDGSPSSNGKHIVLYEAFKRLASQWVCYKVIEIK